MPPETRRCPSHMAADRPSHIKVASSAYFSSHGARVRYPTILSFVERKGIYTRAIFAERLTCSLPTLQALSKCTGPGFLEEGAGKWVQGTPNLW